MDTARLPIGESWFDMQMASKGEPADIYIFDWIGGYELNQSLFARELRAVMASDPSELRIHISSPGGLVSDGVAIYNLIRRADVPTAVYVEGWAASIASLIALAGDTVLIAENAMMMIHNPHGFASGDAAEFRRLADVFDGIRDTLVNTYVTKTGKSAKEIIAALDAETWFSAEAAVAFGLADRVTDEAEAVACWDFEQCKFEQLKPAYMSVGAGCVFADVRGRGRDKVSGGGSQRKETGTVDIKNEADLRTAHPALVQAIESAAGKTAEARVREECTTAQAEAVTAAVTGEQERVSAILEFAGPSNHAKAVELISAGTEALDAARELKKVESGAKKDPLSERLAGDRTLNYQPDAQGDVDPGGAGGGGGGAAAIAAWNEALEAKITGGLTKPQAIKALVKEQPALQKQYLAAHNAQNRRVLASAN